MGDSYYQYWGKSKLNDEGELERHLLPYHCLDVTAVAAKWWDASTAVRRAFCCCADANEATMRAWVLFFICLHDIGKFDVRFQLKVEALWRLLYPHAGTYGSLPSEGECATYSHGRSGLFLLKGDLLDLYGAKTEGLDFLDDVDGSDCEPELWRAWKPWMEAVAGHHGHIVKAEDVPYSGLAPSYSSRLAAVDRNARMEWLSALEKLFLHPVGLSLQILPPPCSSMLAGFCSVADWLGSRSDQVSFSYQAKPQKLDTYFEDRLASDAQRVLDLSGVIGRPQPYSGIGALLQPDQQPRSLQTLVDDLPLEAGLTIVEAPTGSGKTELAVAYAWRLIDAGLADSLIFALPTQATANAMLDRLARMAPLLFEDHPNVLLAHGSAQFNELFARLKHAPFGELVPEDGWAQCSEWLAESRKRVFLGQIGVCTVDQVLISVLPVKHRFVRGFGAGRGILLVDEVHAYDAYMYGLLEEVLKQQKLSSGSAILLSATLPKAQRRQLLNSWGADSEPTEAKALYPLVTWTSGITQGVLALEENQQPTPLAVIVEPVTAKNMLPPDSLLSRIVLAAEEGAQVAVVCNLVDVAQSLASILRDHTQLPVDVFHARFCYRDRQEKELKAIDQFGPRSKRERGRILVATQVIEQSLDLDFDWLITQLCPVDLLFQRMGRLHRHLRPQRPKGFDRPRCTVLLPDESDYGLHGLIYANTRVLWRTAQMVLSAPGGEAVFPEAYRAWIDRVYFEEAWGTEPEDVETRYEQFLDEIFIKKYKALAMLNSAANPFGDAHEEITAVTRDGEMSLTLVPYCASQGGRMLLDGSVFENLGKLQRLEALSLNSIGVPASWRGFLIEPDDQGRFWLEMQKEGDAFAATCKGVVVRYRRETGLEKVK